MNKARTMACAVRECRRSRNVRTRHAILLCSVLLSTLAPWSSGQMQDERAVRAAFVYNLTKYVEWPRPGSELVIGFIGEGSMGGILEKMLVGKTSASRTIRVLLSPSDEQFAQCNVLYVAQASSEQIHSALDKARNKGILTVGETASFPREGGMIGLVRAGDQILIQVNLDVVQEARLKISSRLLNLSTIVRTGKGPKD